MSEETVVTPLPYSDVLPGAVLAEETDLDGTSLVVAADKLPELARHLRDVEGLDLLSNLTAVDYFG